MIINVRVAAHDFVRSQDDELIMLGMHLIHLALQYDPTARQRLLDLWVTDALEHCQLSADPAVREQADALLNRIYGSANATPGPDSGMNTPQAY